MTKLRFILALFSALGFGCSAGTETGNPPAQGIVALGLTAYSSAPDTAALTPGGAGLWVDRVRLSVESVSLLPCAADAPVITLAAGEYDPIDTQLSEAMGSQELCSLRLELAPAKTATVTLPEGVAIYMHGLRTDGSELVVESTSARTLELSSVHGASFGEQPLLLGFDLGSWFTGVDVHNAHAGADGIAHIDSTLNPALLTELEDQTAASVRLYVDHNGNGLLDDAELTPVAAP
jgi:hypothetical protein